MSQTQYALDMNALKPGWYRNDLHPLDNRWWDGVRWADAYWPHSRLLPDYMPGSSRWNISSSGLPSFDIVGENWREDEIAAVIGGRPARDREVEHLAVAELVPEPDNPHDPNAISVRIDGHIVGYLPAQSAIQYREVIHTCVRANVVPTVRARVWAVTRFVQARAREELKSAVRIALPDPEDVLPVNAVPAGPHAVIPRGRKVQVTGEAEHLEALAPFVGRSGQVLATLHPLQIHKPRGTTTVIEVRIDALKVGQLTPAMSSSLLPLVVGVERLGLSTAVWGSLTGSRWAAELALFIAKPESLPGSWPGQGDTVPVLASQRAVPAAFVSGDPILPPPLSRGWTNGKWVLAVAVAIVLMAIPYVGPVLGVAVLVASAILDRGAKRNAPHDANPQPTTAL
jgi:hypothetical protein